MNAYSAAPKGDPREGIMQYFAWGHLASPLQEVAQSVEHLATIMNEDLPDGPEKSAGLRKLLEAKDCFVRARLNAVPSR